MKVESLYRHLPCSLQNVLCSAYGWRERQTRFSEKFWDSYRWLQSTEGSARAEMNAYQDEQVAKLMEHVYRTVPYYRRVMDEHGLKPSDVVSRQDLAKLPVLTKEDVVRHRSELQSAVYNEKDLKHAKTSGTTGTALSFFTTKDAIAFQWAVWWRHRRRFGVEPGTWHLNFTGKPVVPLSQRHPPFWRWNWPMRQALVCMQHLAAPDVQAIVGFINRENFRYFSGYPSLIHTLAMTAMDAGLEITGRPLHIFLGAENLQAQHKEIIEKVFGGKLTDQYGFSEGCGNASRCEYDYYHEDWEFGILECADGELLSDGSVRGRIVASGFANAAFPFIRYEVGDTGVWAPPEFRCPCGRQSRVLLRIEGRNEDYVLTPEGARIMRLDYLFKETGGIQEAQVVQRELGAIVIRVVPRANFSAEDELKMRTMVREWVSPKLEVHIETVREIPRGANRKFRPVVSELALRQH